MDLRLKRRNALHKEKTMRFCRFGDHRLGIVDPGGDTVADVSAALKVLPAQRKLLAPVANPGKISIAPVNYADHLAGWWSRCAALSV
jgi:hypothetical protein